MLAKLDGGVTDQAVGIINEVSERGKVDFVVDVAAKLPLKIVCDLMGVPHSHLDFVFKHSNTILGISDPEYAPADGIDPLTALLVAGGELAELMKDVAQTKQGVETDDLTSLLVNAEIEGEKLSDADIASFFILLVVAGNETTRNAISWGLTYLTDNPDQRQLWQNDFERVAPTAVEEIVRLASPVTYMRRTALQDTELGGVPIAAGEKVLMNYLSANRDEDVYDDPFRFRIDRHTNRHLGFGVGEHFCLGANLAKRSQRALWLELASRLESVELIGEPEWIHSSFVVGLKHLPVRYRVRPATP